MSNNAHTYPLSSQAHLRESSELVIRLTQRGVLDEVALSAAQQPSNARVVNIAFQPAQYTNHVSFIQVLRKTPPHLFRQVHCRGELRGLNLIALQ